jgi:hypothetical protein
MFPTDSFIAKTRKVSAYVGYCHSHIKNIELMYFFTINYTQCPSSKQRKVSNKTLSKRNLSDMCLYLFHCYFVKYFLSIRNYVLGRLHTYVLLRCIHYVC